jgi:hypothetical protein
MSSDTALLQHLDELMLSFEGVRRGGRVWDEWVCVCCV